MSVENYPRFLSECIIRDPGKQSGLRDDEIYGVYLSWCVLNGKQPGTDQEFGAAMKGLGYIKSRNDDGHWPGLFMTGTAAVDYILCSQPSLL